MNSRWLETPANAPKRGNLEDLFEEETEGVGDFVRNCRQLLDLMRQIRDVASDLAPVIDDAVASMDRGVVAAVGPR